VIVLLGWAAGFSLAAAAGFGYAAQARAGLS